MAELNEFANINIQKELTCSICEKISTNPRTLKCLHSFCLKCISDWQASCRRERQPLTCPSCRSVERLEGDDVSSLPSSFHLQPQLQLLRDMKSRDVRDEFKPVKTFGDENGRGKINCPFSIAVSDRGEVAIADWDVHRIVIFSVDGEYLRHFGEKGTGDGQFTHPFSLAFNENRLLVTDNNERTGRLQEVDLNGTSCRTIYIQEGVRIYGMCSTNESIAVCSEALNSQHKSGIKVFNKQSGQLMQHIPCVYSNEVPLYIAYGNGKYFVSYPSKHYIRVFDNNGKSLYKFGEQGKGDGQFNCPRGLAVMNKGIVVCDNLNARVQMFNQDVWFLSSFGGQGSGLGQMYGPNDIAVLPDGRVFVVEWNNHRVHVWR